MIPWARRVGAMVVQHREDRITSMCLGIAGWTCADCPGEWCRHECHRGAAS